MYQKHKILLHNNFPGHYVEKSWENKTQENFLELFGFGDGFCCARIFFFQNQNHTKQKHEKHFFPPRRCCWKSERERTERIKYFWFWQKIVIMYDNNILIFLFLHFYFVPGNWSGSFRLNDFDRWQEKGSTSPAHLFSDLRLLCENFSIWHLSNSKHLFCLFYFWEEVLLIE